MSFVANYPKKLILLKVPASVRAAEHIHNKCDTDNDGSVSFQVHRVFNVCFCTKKRLLYKHDVGTHTML